MLHHRLGRRGHPVSEIAQYRFTPAAMTQTLMDDYTAEVQPRAKAA